jgi:hypothetical protein
MATVDELEVARDGTEQKGRLGQMSSYQYLRAQLQSHLHQDFDLDSGTLPQALFGAVATSDPARLLGELTQLQEEPLDTIREVLDDHDVYIWEFITPEEFLVTLETLAKLYVKEAQIAESQRALWARPESWDGFLGVQASPGSSEPRWYGVKCVFRTPPADGESQESVYEERVTVWRAVSFDEAIQKAEAEAFEYAGEASEYIGYCSAYEMDDGPAIEGWEVYSLMRESPEEPEDYIDRFYDTGCERTRWVGDGD